MQRAEQLSTTETILYDLLTAHWDRFYSSLSPATNHINSRLTITTERSYDNRLSFVINAYLLNLLSHGWKGVRIKEVREMKGQKEEGREEGKRKVYTNSFQQSVPVIPTRTQSI